MSRVANVICLLRHVANMEQILLHDGLYRGIGQYAWYSRGPGLVARRVDDG